MPGRCCQFDGWDFNNEIKRFYYQREATMRSLYLFAILIILGLCSSCASLKSTNVYSIYIETEPPGAEVTLRDKKNIKVGQFISPDSIIVDAGRGFFIRERYSIDLELQGHEDQTVLLPMKLDKWYLSNILFVNLLGLFIIDPITGAMWEPAFNEVLIKLDPLHRN